MSLLNIMNITKSYGSKKVLKGVSLKIQEGETLALLGKNGAGKTTLIKTLAGLLSSDGGEISLKGQNRKEDRTGYQHLIGYVGQDTERSAYARLTVIENLRFFGRLRGIKRSVLENQINGLLRAFHFEERRKTLFSRLSGGQKQTMVIIRALLHNPRVIFLDEPTKGLDPLISIRIRSFLSDYIKGNHKAMLLTSHILPEVEQMADRIAFLQEGQISTILKPGQWDNSLETEFLSRFQKVPKEAGGYRHVQ